ncbi:MAG: cytidine deaminase [Planctomycetes bacterium]|nr:cytidine deaminase [Planctomycetota bacterium]
MDKLGKEDHELIEAARDIIRRRFRQGYHHVAAALRTGAGKVFAAVHLEAHVGRVAVCAEACALAMAAAEGDTEIDCIVAVDRNGAVLSPCGICRELISDFSPQARVIVNDGKRLLAVPIADLLPMKYRRLH